ncbi:replication-relaxation family protein [Paenibacillus peoriae]|uniref:replication-relaxation family protein n=1 Tax=Paenibacillus peoriae TaxID=59893 RepID=UPI00215ABEF1|nr:replication-relaxation family protein [Paenibacillus peoriae]
MKNLPNRETNEKQADYSLGQTIDLLSQMDWTFLIDLYKCRCMEQEYISQLYFNERPEEYYKNYLEADEETKHEIEDQNNKRLQAQMARLKRKLKSRGLIETTSINPDALNKPSSSRGSIHGKTWIYLTLRGLRIVEKRLDIPDEAKLSKIEVDMERAKKEHFWEIAKLYLELKYKIFSGDMKLVQFDEWDWYPSETVASDNETLIIRPDSILKLENQLFYIELDRSTEPVYRSPFFSEQVSIQNKLKRYYDVMRLSTNELIREGYIAIVIPTAKYETRLQNIRKAADYIFQQAGKIFQNSSKVIVSKNIQDILINYADLNSPLENPES